MQGEGGGRTIRFDPRHGTWRLCSRIYGQARDDLVNLGEARILRVTRLAHSFLKRIISNAIHEVKYRSYIDLWTVLHFADNTLQR